MSTTLVWIGALAPLIAAGAAIWVYLAGKTAFRANIARSIVQEVRSAENAIRSLREAGTVVANEVKILPSNSWKDNSHLFANILSGDELDQIERFYTGCEFIDRSIRKFFDTIFLSYDRVAQKHIDAYLNDGTPMNQQLIGEDQEVAKAIASQGGVFSHLFYSRNAIVFIGDSRAMTKIRKIAGEQ